MATRIHPFTGEPLNGKPNNGKPRAELQAYYLQARGPDRADHRAKLSYDAARNGNDLDNHWRFADALDSDAANSKTIRHRLIHRSRYESGSNGYYAGILRTHCNFLVGTGPTLRMLTGNRDFNQLVEREFHAWAEEIQLRRKLWCMAHARFADGECFAVLQNNPGLKNRVQLDVMPIEAEQCQTPLLPTFEVGYIDGIRFDTYGNVQWYDVLEVHPGSEQYVYYQDPVRVAPQNMLHWFQLVRPGAHRGKPDCTPSLNVGATSRRHREATVGAAETAASIGALLTSTLNPAGNDEPDPVAPFTSVEWAHRMLTAAPMGWQATQMKGEHPNAQYSDFHRLQISEQARPLSMPYNVAASDSSTYSFASGKLDTLGYFAEIDVDRADCNDLVLNRIFAAWFREWTIVASRRDIPPLHQWDWPRKPVVDAVAEETAKDKKLKNGSITLRQVYSDEGKDYEDELQVMAEDWFGDATEENLAKARQLNVLRNLPPHAVPYAAAMLGLPAAAAPAPPTTEEATDGQA